MQFLTKAKLRKVGRWLRRVVSLHRKWLSSQDSFARCWSLARTQQKTYNPGCTEKRLLRRRVTASLLQDQARTHLAAPAVDYRQQVTPEKHHQQNHGRSPRCHIHDALPAAVQAQIQLLLSEWLPSAAQQEVFCTVCAGSASATDCNQL